jgi:hypothetical protein
MREASVKALDVLESFADASRAELPELDRSVRRPPLSETRAEVKRQACQRKPKSDQLAEPRRGQYSASADNRDLA